MIVTVEEDSIRVQLTRIEGGVALLNERLSAAREDIRDIRVNVTAIDGRVTKLEAASNVNAGERKGLSTSGRLLWGILIGLLTSGIGAALLRHFGV